MKLLWIIALSCLSLEAKCSIRVKRVLHGDRVHGRTSGYRSVNYFATFGTAHGKPWYSLGFWNVFKKHGLYGQIICGGAVLTPNIVQTACHCIATYPFSYKGAYVDPALINHHWEGFMAVYIGTNHRFPTWGHEDEPSMLTIPPIESQKFFVHPKCGKMPQTSNVAGSFDVGLIRISSQWASGHYGVPIETVVFAPLYSHEHLVHMFDRFMETQPTCLIIGFGYYGDDYPYPSDAILQGWVTLRDYESCIKSTTEDIPAKSNYTVYLSWACARPMIKYNQSADSGDSGGPISCDNEFFGVASSIFYEGRYRTDVYTANRYTPFVNAYEGRAALLELVGKPEALSYPDEVHFFYKTKTPHPDLRGITKYLLRQQEYKVQTYGELQEPPRMSSSLLASDQSLLAMILVSAFIQ